MMLEFQHYGPHIPVYPRIEPAATWVASAQYAEIKQLGISKRLER